MVKFRPRLRQPRFNYNKQLDAEPILYKPEAILKPVTNETKVKLNSLPEVSRYCFVAILLLATFL